MIRRQRGKATRLGTQAFLRRLWADDRAAEVAEWVIVVAFVALTVIVIYRGILVQQLSSTLDRIESNIESAASGS